MHTIYALLLAKTPDEVQGWSTPIYFAGLYQTAVVLREAYVELYYGTQQPDVSGGFSRSDVCWGRRSHYM